MMSTDPIRYELDGGIAVLHFDDGKANVLSPTSIAALHRCLDRAAEEAGAVLLVGRPGRFSAGFDLTVMREGPESTRSLVSEGCKLLARMLTFSRPIVSACSGHALAAGAMLLLASDVRVGVEGAFKIGLNEVAIGLRPPLFLIEIAGLRLTPRHFHRSVVHAEIYDPSGAVDAGFLDRIVPSEGLVDVARAQAVRLASLSRDAFGAAKERASGAVAKRMVDELERDMRTFDSPS